MYKLKVLVNGRSIPKYHDREGNIWVEARYGTRYSIEVKNDTWKRALAVISVDGLNVVNGKRKEPSISTGYVISPYNNVIVKGWRIGSDQVKEFYFTTPQDSYSNKLGADKKNIGVIGCFIYEEVPKISYSYTSDPDPFCPPPIPYRLGEVTWGAEPLSSAADYLCAMDVSSPQNISSSDNQRLYSRKMATGSGNKLDDRSHKVHFGKKVLAASMVIYYDSKENLVRRGVIRDNCQSLFLMANTVQICKDNF